MIVAATAFFLSVAVLVHVVFMYPLLLGIMARRRPERLQHQAENRTVSVILPVRNGEQWIVKKLECLQNLNYPPHLLEIIVVCDGCTDRTASLARSVASKRLRIIETPSSGKAAAINVGIAHASGEILFMNDVRQYVHAESLRWLIACFNDPNIGAASGELVISNGKTSSEHDVGLYWRYEKWIRRNLSRIDSILGATGAIYAIRRELAVKLPPGTLLDDVYLPLSAFFRGYRVVMEDNAKAFDHPTSLNQEFHRKVRTLAGVYQVISRFPELLQPSKNRMWFHFMSHKVGRLAMPFLLMAIFATSFAFPDPWWKILVGTQVAFYLLAIFDTWVPEKLFLKRVTSPVRTFVALVIAALFALKIFVRPSESLWKHTQVNVAKPAA